MKKSNSFACVLSVLLVSAFLGVAAHAAGLSVEVTATFDYPGAVLTNAYGINNNNQVVGSYVDGVSGTLGFIRAANGTFSAPLDDPENVNGVTEPRGINDDGTVCGYYFGGNGFDGFLFANGSYTTYEVLGQGGTELSGINNAGDLAAFVLGGPGYVVIGGTTMALDIPGAIYVYPRGLNAGDQVAGTSYDANNVASGFYTDADGVLQSPIVVPHAKNTALFGINDADYMTGYYVSGSGRNQIVHGLLFVPPRQFVTVDYPGATEVVLTGINNRGIICGYYMDSAHHTHGLLARVRGGRQ